MIEARDMEAFRWLFKREYAGVTAAEIATGTGGSLEHLRWSLLRLWRRGLAERRHYSARRSPDGETGTVYLLSPAGRRHAESICSCSAKGTTGLHKLGCSLAWSAGM